MATRLLNMLVLCFLLFHYHVFIIDAFVITITRNNLQTSRSSAIIIKTTKIEDDDINGDDNDDDLMPLGDLKIERCVPPFDSSIYNFYRYNFDKKRSKKRVPSLPQEDISNNNITDDVVYILRSSPNNIIVASLRLTRSKDDSNYTFLRSMCVSREYRGRRLSVKLMEESLLDFQSIICYCFASPYLETLYDRAGFIRIPKNQMNSTAPKWLVQSFKSMDARWSRKTLGLFVKQAPSNITIHNNKTRIILLQHGLENSKKTATGWLLNDELYQQSKMTAAFVDDLSSCQLSDSFNLHRWVWNGRNHTQRVETKLQELDTKQVYLLWTGGTSSTTSAIKKTSSSSPITFIILDGTWQQAKTMYKRIPALWKLPKILLENTSPSNYTLRKDYSGYKEKFGTKKNGNLLCTAEVAAAVLDSTDEIAATAIRNRLKQFQASFLKARDGRDYN